ncbi:MAG TPA: alkaline phosphatase family protein [Actinomycetota bacterium]|nr:alkaline phosphatase family protein [Actinomycetota bacterium]
MALIAAACAGSSPRGTSSAGSSPTTSPSPSGFARVIVIVMENKAFGDVIGNPEAAYINSLARRYGLAGDYYAVAHPSLPNYIALLGGKTFDIRSDCTDCHVDAPNLVDRLEGAGISWKAYMEGLPSPCFTGASAGGYAKKHNPFFYFDDVVGDPTRCSKVVPLDRLDGDLASDGLARFVWITPDQCHDMHDCGVAQGDRFLKGLIPRLLPTLGPNGVLFLTWDESSSYAEKDGGRVATIVAGPKVRKRFRSTVGYSHYSLLRTIEGSWGLDLLGSSGCPCTLPMSEFFRPS